MAITAYNQTTGSIIFNELSIPHGYLGASGSASGSAILTDYNSIYEIQNSDELRNYVNLSFVVLNNGSGILSLSGSLDLLDPVDTSGSILNENQHKSYRSLIHFLNEGPGNGFGTGLYREVVPSGSMFPTRVTWKTSSTGSKIVEGLVTYNPTRTINTEQWSMYDSVGTTIIEQIIDTVTYQGIFELYRIRTTSGSN